MSMRRAVLVLIVASILVPAVPASATAACGPPRWQIVPTPNDGDGDNDLRGVTALSATDAWAVGSRWDDVADHVIPLTAHWDGAEWRLVPTPAVGEAGGLMAVHGSESDRVWAAGFFSTSDGQVAKALLQRWTGTAWDAVDVPAPAPGPDVTEVLLDVLALPAGDGWAVGRWALVTDGIYSPLILRRNGQEWTVVEGPSFETWSELMAVSATGPDDVWFVGDTEVEVEEENALVERGLIMHWDGHGFTTYEAPFNRRHPLNPFGLEDVVAISETDAWAVGSIQRASGRMTTLTLHWDGVKWSRVTAPQPSDTEQALASVTALSSDHVWTVGSFEHDRSGEFRTLVLRWNGERWRVMSSANRRTGGDLYEVTAVEDWRFAVGAAWSHRLRAYRTLGLERCTA